MIVMMVVIVMMMTIVRDEKQEQILYMLIQINAITLEDFIRLYRTIYTLLELIIFFLN